MKLVKILGGFFFSAVLLLAPWSLAHAVAKAPAGLQYNQADNFVPASTDSSTGLDAAGDFDLAPTGPQLADSYYRAVVTRILEAGKENVDGQMQDYQKLEMQILNGPSSGQMITIDNGGQFTIGQYQPASVGETLVIAKPAATPGVDQSFYYIVDKYRLTMLGLLAAIFFGLAFYFGRKRGVTSIIGMLFSVLVLFYWVIPHILAGGDALTTSVIGAVVIIVLSLYLSHGFNRRTSIALLSTLIALVLAVVIDLVFVHVAKLSGIGTEEAFYLQFDTIKINMQGLLLGGIIIGVLGVLDDVTTGQTAAIEEIFTANPSLDFKHLYKSGLSIGREHIASLINTLVLAYVGAAFPLLLLYSSQQLQPLWVTLNSNFIAEEVVRTLVGSSVLVVAVPLTTLLAAWFYSRRRMEFPPMPANLTSEIAATEQFYKDEKNAL